MTLYLENDRNNQQLELWNGQEYARETDVGAEIFNPASVDASETVLSVLQQSGSIVINGVTVGGQRIDDGATSKTDPVNAVAEWVGEAEAWVNGTPAVDAYTLRNDYTGETINVAPRSVSWTREAGATQSVSYTVELTLGGGQTGDLGIAPTDPTPNPTDLFDGVELPHIYERQVEKGIELDSFQDLLAESPEDNDLVLTASPVRRVTLLGELDKTFSEQRTFDQQLTSRAGDGNTYTFTSAFPGRDTEAALVGYESTREAGVTQRGEYALELVGGTAV
jgi:hypothetical protein